MEIIRTIIIIIINMAIIIIMVIIINIRILTTYAIETKTEEKKYYLFNMKQLLNI